MCFLQPAATLLRQALYEFVDHKFDDETAVEVAMLVFWEKSYEGASLRNLTQAMGIDRKSMYLSLGDKEALFKKVLARYNTTQLAFVPVAFAKPTLREFVDYFLNMPSGSGLIGATLERV
jgi:AcrR family transcriptional regulator